MAHDTQSTGPITARDAPAALAKAAIYWCVHLIALVGFLVLMLKVVPTFERMFKEFELDLPIATKLIIAISQYTVVHWWLAALIVPLVNGMIWVELCLLGSKLRWARRLWLYGPLALALIVCLAVLLTMALPYWQLAENLQ